MGDSVRGLGADGRQLLRTAATNGTPAIPLEKLRTAFESEYSALQKMEPQLRLAVDQAERQARTAPPAAEELACVLDDECETAPLTGGTSGRMNDQIQQQNNEVAREQALRREQGIRRVFGDVQQVQKMFVDMAQVVAEQGEQISSLGGNVQAAREYTDVALEEVSIAQRRRERYRKTLIRNGQFLGASLLLLLAVWHFCVPSFAGGGVGTGGIPDPPGNTLPMAGPIPQPEPIIQDVRAKKR